MTNKVVKLTYLKNKYNVLFSDGQAFNVHEDIIVNYRLVKDKILTCEEFISFKEDIVFFDYYNMALKYSISALKSSYDIKNYLRKKKIEEEIIIKIIEKLKTNKIIDDKTYILSATDYLVRGGYGKFYLKNKFNQMEFSRELITETLDSIDEENYYKYLVAQMNKQLKNYQKYPKELRKTKITRYLLQRGFEYELICVVISEMPC